MNLKQKLSEIAMANGMKYFKVAPVERLSNLPEGHRPTDLLPSGKAVIVMGMVIPDGAIQGNLKAVEGVRHAIFTYTKFGYININQMLDWAAMMVILHLEQQHQKKAYGIPASKPRDELLFMSAMSHRYAAVCAGHGQFGWSGFVLTPDDGPRVRWISVITEAELEPDPLYQGPNLCDTDKCNICVEVCPTNALSQDEGVEVRIGDLKATYSRRNKPLCRCATHGLVKGVPGRLQAEVPDEMNSMEDWLAFSKKDSPWQRMEFSHGNYCHRCMVMCPVGK